MQIFDLETHFFLGDPEIPPFPPNWQPDEFILESSLENMILSASGWRKIFAADGEEESLSAEVSPEDKLLVAMMGYTFGSFLKEKSGKENPLLLLGTDCRPTGPLMAEMLIRIFLSLGMRVEYSFITAAPEIMARIQEDHSADGFTYVSASHNPLGHNGLKFGLNDGGVIGGGDAARLILDYRNLVSRPESRKQILMDLASVPSSAVEAVFKTVPDHKSKSLNAYRSFARRVISGRQNPAEQNDFFSLLSEKAGRRGIGIIGEHNGSARTLSIDSPFLSEAGIIYRGINDKPRQTTHRIVPEGPSLYLCREKLEQAYATDKRFILGYVPDNDGDRGNIVYIDEKTGCAEILEAQEVFALSSLGELTFLDYLDVLYPGDPELKKPRAVAVNGPTSLRIETLAGFLDARVFRAEVGEANVVNRAREAREAGFCVPILGEGSNGGNITYPAAVRDPLNTIFALIKLLLIQGDGKTPGLFESWCCRSGRPELFHPDFTLSDILASLPVFTTTSAFEDQALMKIKTQDHGLLKARYENNFPAQWEKWKEELRNNWGIVSWEEINYEGTKAVKGTGKSCRSGAERGGLKINFLNSREEPVGFIWMRGSGTEPVFRIMAEIKGKNREAESRLLSWQREMIEAADRG